MFLVTAVILVFITQQNACNITEDGQTSLMTAVWQIVKNIIVNGDIIADMRMKPSSINNHHLNLNYWNSELGNDKPIRILKGREDELMNYWIPELPLKVIIHGWLDSSENDESVFSIKAVYLGTGEYNVISADWRTVAGNRVYAFPALMTAEIGAALAEVLDNMVELDMVDPGDIHLIGHSLGAHVAGACGSSLKSGEIGRITGLDPAGPGFEYAGFGKRTLRKTDARFVDVIHTSAGLAGHSGSLGHADFHPNGGSAPQPGCYEGVRFKSLLKLVGCSHSRAYRLYADSILNGKSMVAVRCASWTDYREHKCDENARSPMGHDASPEARGDFYLKTAKSAPFAVQDLKKEDL